MPSIDIQHPHSLTPVAARQAVQEVADKLADRFGVDCRWDGDILNFSRSGVDGRIALLPHQLHVSAQLGFLFGAMKGTIESEIRRVLAERFG
ncbi:MAG: polyhydroxyalkanoic acid system family protein [Proteobacteria bacterium]|nr:polyhydroxyalkanoic acid system family protein [Pseudomonadota bacterium]